MKICFVPIDNRPVCYNLVKDICSIDEDISLIMPPRELLGSLQKYADRDKILEWLKNITDIDCMILSLDTLAYGGLIPSRRIPDSYVDISSRMQAIKPILKNKKVYAFSSIMRISNNNYNEEEKAYWKDYGKKIFEYSYKTCETGIRQKSDIPQEILDDWLSARKRNFEINKMYLNWQKEGFFDTLIFSKDDCAKYGFNIAEARELERLGAYTKTGADEIPLTLLAKAIKKDIKIFPVFTEPEYKNRISNYEDVTVEKSVTEQLELGGFSIASCEKEADVVLVVNNFIEKQGELVMGWKTKPYNKEFIPPSKPYAVADIRYANGADNKFINQILSPVVFPEYGYSGWNTSANSIGSLLAAVKVKFKAKKYNDCAFKKLQSVRLLDDWAYQANIRQKINYPDEIESCMKPYEKRIQDTLNIRFSADYTYPWNRKFEIETNLFQFKSFLS